MYNWIEFISVISVLGMLVFILRPTKKDFDEEK